MVIWHWKMCDSVGASRRSCPVVIPARSAPRPSSWELSREVTGVWDPLTRAALKRQAACSALAMLHAPGCFAMTSSADDALRTWQVENDAHARNCPRNLQDHPAQHKHAVSQPYLSCADARTAAQHPRRHARRQGACPPAAHLGAAAYCCGVKGMKLFAQSSAPCSRLAMPCGLPAYHGTEVGQSPYCCQRLLWIPGAQMQADMAELLMRCQTAPVCCVVGE